MIRIEYFHRSHVDNDHYAMILSNRAESQGHLSFILHGPKSRTDTQI